MGPQDRGKLAARLANARAQRNAAGRKIFPLRKSSAGAEQALPKQPVALRPGHHLWRGLGVTGPVGGGPHSAARGPTRPGARAGGSGGQLLPTGQEPRVAASQARECLR